MKRAEVREIVGYLTFGTYLSKLYILSDDYFGNQTKFFAGLFKSYCGEQSRKLKMEWEPASNSVSLLMRKAHGAPRNLYRHYCNYDTCALREDVEQYVSRVVVTNKQHVTHITQLTAMIEQSHNLNMSDKEYILTLVDVDSGQMLVELLYRSLYVLLREPSGGKDM